MCTRCGTFLMFVEILPGEEVHCKPLWRVFPNALRVVHPYDPVPGVPVPLSK